MKNTLKIQIALIILVIAFVVVKIFSSWDEIKEADIRMEESIKNREYIYNESFYPEDSTIINNKRIKDLHPILLIKSTFRNNIRLFEYKDSARIYYTRLELKKNKSLVDLINLNKKNIHETVLRTYEQLSRGKFDLLFLGESTPLLDSIIINCDIDDKEIIKKVFNENFISYSFTTSNLSIQYGEKYPVDIYFGGIEYLFGIRSDYQIIVSFYKINNSVYFVILIPNKKNYNLNIELMKELMQDNNFTK